LSDPPRNWTISPARAFLLLMLYACAETQAAEPPAYPVTSATVFQTGYELPVLSMSDDTSSVQPIATHSAASPESVLTLPEAYPQDEQLPADCSGMDDGVPYRGVTPYGGGHIDDWPWGCGGSPYRTGPGWCDDWLVGPVWDIAVDGMTLYREDADLAAIEAAAANPDPAQYTNQFDYAGGGRVFATGKIPRGVGYRLQFGYEGVQDWNAAIVYPEVVVDPMTDLNQRRSIHYNSSFNSAEFNVLPLRGSSVWQPYVGVRYVRFADEIRDKTDQFAPPPLPDLPPVITMDDRSVFDIKNNLIGFQTGMRVDLWQLSRRLSLEGFVNAGVYYNAVQRTDSMSTTTTIYTADDTTTPDVIETNTSSFTTGTSVRSSPAEVAYLAEASLSGVCRVNRCLAVRAGYQVLWIDGLHLASDAYLNSNISERSMWFDGWHVGAEYRR
jgi:hypothetical protein